MKMQLELSGLFATDKNNKMVIYNDRQLSFIIKLDCQNTKSQKLQGKILKI